MVEPKTNRKTWAQKLCENDPDLKCPQHDRMSFVLGDIRAMEILFSDARVFDSQFEISQISLEYPIIKGAGEYQSIVGFADAAADVIVEFADARGGGKERRLVLIEAKPKIENPMETLRQIKTYLAYKKAKFLLWCPNISDRTAEIFRSQRVFVSGMSIEILEDAIPSK